VIPNDSLVSGKHCVFQNADNGWVVEDLDSTNGTMLNEQELKRSTLKDGDVVTIGGTRFKFQLRSGKTEPLPRVSTQSTPANQSASDLRATQVVDYDEIMDALPSANAAPVKDYDELLSDLPGSNTSPTPTLPPLPVAPANTPPPKAPAKTPVGKPARREGKPTDTYYDQMFEEAGRGEGEFEAAGKSAGGAGGRQENSWLETPSQTNMLVAMGSIALLFLVMIMFFNRLV